ncbi:hypothetical protein G5B47_23105 [Paenibacillus sp. 7124]|uniref:Uncharacterized protein n=1 Tax=Paenibacillus apii TaxID=1850370 RepID=A0A6M1PPZ4_9BACL|nr:hypothetical protein [Paenibacillus apii]NGM85296.1 hypothetical protein [Paenibacillus apii]
MDMPYSNILKELLGVPVEFEGFSIKQVFIDNLMNGSLAGLQVIPRRVANVNIQPPVEPFQSLHGMQFFGAHCSRFGEDNWKRQKKQGPKGRLLFLNILI